MDKYQRVYEAMVYRDRLDLEEDKTRVAAIIQEMIAIEKAQSLREAANVVKWWDCWESDQQLIGWVRKARRMLNV